MDSRVQDGFLVIADVSGYTSFLTGTEMEHAQSIMEELTQLLLGRLGAPLKLVKLEGDAVLCCAPEAAVPNGERLIDQLEACYFEFRSHLEDMKRSTTCVCNACSGMQSLDLKFFVHHGRWMIQRVPGTPDDLAGPDVILVHRLLKNEVAEKTGTRAYLLLTRAASEKMGTRLELAPHAEEYEHIGRVECGVLNLRARYDATREAHREKVEAADSHFTFVHELEGPPPLVWRCLVEPALAQRWMGAGKATVTASLNPLGRAGAGGAMHCAHGGSVTVMKFVDVRPFSYLTTHCNSTGMGPPPHRLTYELEPLDGGRTRFTVRIQGFGFGAKWVLKLVGGLLRKGFAAGMPMLQSAVDELSQAATDAEKDVA